MNITEVRAGVQNNSNLVGKTVKHIETGVLYTVKEVIGAPAFRHQPIFLDFHIRQGQSWEMAITRYLRDQDLEVAIITTDNELFYLHEIEVQ